MSHENQEANLTSLLDSHTKILRNLLDGLTKGSLRLNGYSLAVSHASALTSYRYAESSENEESQYIKTRRVKSVYRPQ